MRDEKRFAKEIKERDKKLKERNDIENEKIRTVQNQKK
jgi:hypothetical protein